ncbi:hypothetical protein Bca52824_012494 [Brassica carinata]|uniref:Uncharacterized protein n=1 Tax=Brassica carinata TaxID=52824 RepID=A0A8X7VWY4_BRACI|nr:hypothetical protein Bca52824_012494 [Brassica carinata]
MLCIYEFVEMKGKKRKRPSSMSGGVSTRTRARKTVSDGNQPVGDGVRETTVVSLSLDSESEDMSAVSSQAQSHGGEGWEYKSEKLAKKAQGTTKKRGRPNKTAATLKPCTPLTEKRKGEPSRWVQSPFNRGKDR